MKRYLILGLVALAISTSLLSACGSSRSSCPAYSTYPKKKSI